MLLFKVSVVVIWNYKDPNSAISKMHGKSIIFPVDPIFFFFFFHATVVPKIIPKVHKETELTMVLTSSIGLYYLLDCDYLLQYEAGITVFHYLFYMESHMPLASASAIGAFQ